MEFIVSNANKQSALNQICDHFQALEPDEVFKVEIKPLRGKRSTDQNSLYWRWLTVAADYFSKRGQKFTKDDMHDLFRHLFLGYESRVIGHTKLQEQLKSTSKLDSSEMAFYMNQVDMWCADKKLLLPKPEDNQYTQYAREAA